LAVCLGIGQAKGAILRVFLYGLLAIAAILLSDHVAKPLIDRTYYGELTFPSGHVTAATATSLAVWLALFPFLEKGARALAGVIGLAWILLTSVAVVAGLWHTPIDVVGAVLFAIGIVTAGAALLELPVISKGILAAQVSARSETNERQSGPNVDELLGETQNPVGIAQTQGVDQEKG
jgi:membrane-associated phospholipid phosphatase